MDKATAIERVRKYAELVRRHFDVRSIVLFGSHTRGTAQEYSDIDVAVILDKLDGDWLTSAAMLHKLTRDIDLSIEPVLVLRGQDRGGFLEHVLKTGEVIYSREA